MRKYFAFLDRDTDHNFLVCAEDLENASDRAEAFYKTPRVIRELTQREADRREEAGWDMIC